jgi:predicted PurR-regulated permease PerM
VCPWHREAKPAGKGDRCAGDILQSMAADDGRSADHEAHSSGRVVVPRWVQAALIPALLIIGWLFLGIIGQAVFIFLAASLLALVLNPLVNLLKRARVPRFIGVFLVYLVAFALVVGLAVLLMPAILHQLKSLLSSLPSMTSQAKSLVDQLQHLADRFHLHIDVGAQLQRVARSAADRVPSMSGSVLGIGVSVVRTITVLIVIVVISIYMLLHARRISRFVVDHFPTRSRSDGETYVRLAQSAVVDYVKAQLLLSGALGLSAGVAMWILGVTGVFPSGSKYAAFFGAWTAVMEIIPYVGPFLAAVPPSIVALLHSPLTMVWVILTYLAIQQIEGHVLTPTIMGSRLRVHPLVVIFVILAGQEIHGISGMFVAVPLIPLVRETYLFLRPRVRFEGWDLHPQASTDDDDTGGRGAPPDPDA